LRPRIADNPGHGGLHGQWWPHSRDLAARSCRVILPCDTVELADLVDHFPPPSGNPPDTCVQRTSQHPGVRVTMDRGIRLDLRPWRHRIALTTRHDDPATTPPVVLELVDISFAGHHVVSQPTDKRWPPA
jgi:hypothetical protein